MVFRDVWVLLLVREPYRAGLHPIRGFHCPELPSRARPRYSIRSQDHVLMNRGGFIRCSLRSQGQAQVGRAAH